MTPRNFTLLSFHRIQETYSIMSFSVSDDGRHVLLNLATQVRGVSDELKKVVRDRLHVGGNY